MLFMSEISEKEQKEIEKEAKEILDKFALSLEKAGIEEKEEARPDRAGLIRYWKYNNNGSVYPRSPVRSPARKRQEKNDYWGWRGNRS